MNNNTLQKIPTKNSLGLIIKDNQNACSLIILLFKNLIGLVPAFGPALAASSGVLADYYDAKVTKRREKEINSHIKK